MKIGVNVSIRREYTGDLSIVMPNEHHTIICPGIQNLTNRPKLNVAPLLRGVILGQKCNDQPRAVTVQCLQCCVEIRTSKLSLVMVIVKTLPFPSLDIRLITT